MDLVLKNARPLHDPERVLDIGVADRRIVAMEPAIEADAERLDVGGRLVTPGFVETHIHLDKSCILDRCTIDRGDIEEAIAETGRAKAGFDAEDVYARGSRTIEKSILQGTTHMRTHLEVDPGIGLRGLEGIRRLAKDYAWAVDIEICVFPQEGLLNNPGTDELMVAALKDGARIVGAAPYTDSDPHGQIDRVFALAREFDADIDMHLDFGADPSALDLAYVCTLAERFGWGGRTAVGHVTKLAYLTPERRDEAARRMADAGVALTVLPATDLFLRGRDRDHAKTRGVAETRHFLAHGVNCSLSTNNVLNPFTPFGDCSLVRMANLEANIGHVGSPAGMAEGLDMVTGRAARLMNLKDYGLAMGGPADFAVLDATSPGMAVAELAPVLHGFKNGRRTMTREPARLNAPQ